MQNYYNKYGDVFEYEVLLRKEIETDKDMFEIEKEYISNYNAFDLGFNLSRGGRGCSGYIRETRLLPTEHVQQIKRLFYFKVYDLKLLAAHYNSSRAVMAYIRDEKLYKDVKLRFDSYAQYEFYKEKAEKYRFPQIIKKIEYLYNYIIENPEATCFPRAVRNKQRPEGLANSILREDYACKGKIDFILETCEKFKHKSQLAKSELCLKVLKELEKCNNSTAVAKKLNLTPKTVDSIKHGKQFGKFHKELREKVRSLPLYKDTPFYNTSRERLSFLLFKTNSLSETAKCLEVNKDVIPRWCKKFNIPSQISYYKTIKLN